MRLKCTKGPIRGESFELVPSFKYVLGREPSSSEEHESIELDSQTVSRSHAELEFDGVQWVIRDLQSFNGVRVNRSKELEAAIESGDQIELGEFSFLLESDEYAENSFDQDEQEPRLSDTRSYNSSDSDQMPEDRTKKTSVEKLKKNWRRVDFKWKVYAILGLFSLIGHWVVYTPIVSTSKEQLLNESFKTATSVIQRLGNQQIDLLQNEDYVLVNCDAFQKPVPGFQAIYLLKPDGSAICPLGKATPADNLVEVARQNESFVSNCSSSFDLEKQSFCSLVHPIFEQSSASKRALLGFARLDYYPVGVKKAMDQFSKTRMQTFLFLLALLLFAGFLMLNWLKRGVSELCEDVRLLFAGTAQSVEKVESFSQFSGLIEEINRLNSKQNQSVGSEALVEGVEASFLQSLCEQVFLLEERAMMAVDSDNNILAITEDLPNFIPLHEEHINVHVTEGIADTHLQGELMTYLNELSMGSEVIDRGLSMSDRVVQVRGMPVYLAEGHVATLLIFGD